MTVLYEPLRQQAQHLAMLVGGDIHTAVTLDEVTTLINHDREELLVIFGPGVPLSEAVSFASAQRITRPPLGVVLLRPHLEVVLEHDRLPVQSEGRKRGVALQDIDHTVHDAPERELEVLERPVPLAVPVRVRDEVQAQLRS